MAITGVNDYTSYTNYYTDTKQKSGAESAKKAADNQVTEKLNRSGNLREGMICRAGLMRGHRWYIESIGQASSGSQQIGESGSRGRL